MDPVNKVGIQSSTLGLTHQSNPTPPTSGAGAPNTVSGDVAAQQPQKSHAKAPVDGKGKASAVDEFLKNLKSATMRLRISQDDTLGIFVYQSVDPVSGKVQEQYPSEERLKQLAYFATLDSKDRGTSA